MNVETAQEYALNKEIMTVGTLGFPLHRSALLVIDAQERLARAMSDFAACEKAIHNVICAAAELKVDILVTEQYPSGLGSTVPNIAAVLPPNAPVIAKTSFSCLGCNEVTAALQARGPECLVLSGVETHVCVQQTALAAAARGLRVAVLADAVTSRHSTDKDIALELMRRHGVLVTTVEALVFDWLEDASHPSFKTVSRLFR